MSGPEETMAEQLFQELVARGLATTVDEPDEDTVLLYKSYARHACEAAKAFYAVRNGEF